MFYVSRYSNKALENENVIPIQISVGLPKFKINYELKGEIGLLKPFGLFKIQDQEDFDIAYTQQLERHGVEKIRRCLNHFKEEGKDTVLLCFEDVRVKPCHRTTFAEWWKEKTGEEIPEYPEPEKCLTKKEDPQKRFF